MASVSDRIPVTLDAAEKLPIRSGRRAYGLQLGRQVSQVDVPVGVGADDHDVGDGLPPRQLVGVVLVRSDEHHRPLRGRDLAEQPVALRWPLGQPQLQDADQLVDGRGGPGAAEDHQVVVVAADRVVDDLAGVLP